MTVNEKRIQYYVWEYNFSGFKIFQVGNFHLKTFFLRRVELNKMFF